MRARMESLAAEFDDDAKGHRKLERETGHRDPARAEYRVNAECYEDAARRLRDVLAAEAEPGVAMYRSWCSGCGDPPHPPNECQVRGRFFDKRCLCEGERQL